MGYNSIDYSFIKDKYVDFRFQLVEGWWLNFAASGLHHNLSEVQREAL